MWLLLHGTKLHQLRGRDALLTGGGDCWVQSVVCPGAVGTTGQEWGVPPCNDHESSHSPERWHKMCPPGSPRDGVRLLLMCFQLRFPDSPNTLRCSFYSDFHLRCASHGRRSSPPSLCVFPCHHQGLLPQRQRRFLREACPHLLNKGPSHNPSGHACLSVTEP